MPGLYFHDAWLWLYNFSKLRKLGVNLAVSNHRVFQMPVNYVILHVGVSGKITALPAPLQVLGSLTSHAFLIAYRYQTFLFIVALCCSCRVSRSRILLHSESALFRLTVTLSCSFEQNVLNPAAWSTRRQSRQLRARYLESSWRKSECIRQCHF